MRVRWLNVNGFGKERLKRAADGMAAEPFGDQRNSGFLIERKRSGFVEGKYVERFDWIENVSDPFGKTVQVQRHGFQQTGFRLNLDCPTIEVYDSPRSISPFLNRLEVILKSNFVLEPIEVEALVWLKKMEDVLHDQLITSVTVSRLSLSERTFAQISIRGTEDVRAHVASIVGKRPFKIDRVVIAAVYEDEPVRFVLRRDGRANIVTGPDDFISVLRDGLAKVLSSLNH